MLRSTLLIILFFSFTTLTANPMLNLKSGQQAFTYETGMDFALLPTVLRYELGYSMFGDNHVFKTHYRINTFAPDLGDYEFKIGSKTSPFYYQKWGLFIEVGTGVRGLDSDAIDLTAIFGDLKLLGGWVGDSWDFLMELEHDRVFTTKITHHKAFKDVITDLDTGKGYFEDGWYSNTGGYQMFGMAINWKRPKYEISFRMGLFTSDQMNVTSLGVPIYNTLGFTYKFGG